MALLQQDDIIQIFPRIKDRVKFVHRRTELISNLNEDEGFDGVINNSLKSKSSSLSQSSDLLQQNDLPNSFTLTGNRETTDRFDQTTDS